MKQRQDTGQPETVNSKNLDTRVGKEVCLVAVPAEGVSFATRGVISEAVTVSAIETHLAHFSGRLDDPTHPQA
jgi:hypothetical protein